MNSMNIALVIFSFFAASTSLAAERAVIQQMKGKRAILHFEKDIPFSVGQKVYLNSDSGTEYGVQKELRNPLERKNSINLTSAFFSTSEPKTTAMEITGRYGWNFSRYEFGPTASFSYEDSASDLSRYEFGAFIDFNLIPNKPGEDFIWGGYAEAALGNTKFGVTSRSLTVFTGGGFTKWFIFSPMLAVRVNLLYSVEIQNVTRNTTGAEIGLTHYF